MSARSPTCRPSPRCPPRRARTSPRSWSLGAACLVAAALRSCASSTPVCSRCCSVLAIATSAAKIELPLGRSQSNLSLSHAVNFWALFALGPGGSRLHRGGERLGPVHAARRAAETRLHRIVFSIGSLTLTVVGRRAAAGLLMGPDAPGIAALVRTAAVVAPLYFFVNTGAGRRRDRALHAAAGGARLAAQLPVERAELPGRRGARGRRDGGVGTRLVRMARAARGAALPGLPQLPHRRRAAARRAG